MKPNNASASLYQLSESEVKVWCASFTLKGSLPKLADGSSNPKAMKKIQKNFSKFLESIEFPDWILNG